MSLYREEVDSTFIHDGLEYSINSVLELVESVPVVKVLTKDLKWVLKYTSVDEKRVNLADLNTHILIASDKLGRPTVIDGAHRLTKAVRESVEKLPAKWVSKTKLKKCLV